MVNVTNPIIIDQFYCDQDKPCKEQVIIIIIIFIKHTINNNNNNLELYSLHEVESNSNYFGNNFSKIPPPPIPIVAISRVKRVFL